LSIEKPSLAKKFLGWVEGDGGGREEWWRAVGAIDEEGGEGRSGEEEGEGQGLPLMRVPTCRYFGASRVQPKEEMVVTLKNKFLEFKL
jgi:hypothetical protein